MTKKKSTPPTLQTDPYRVYDQTMLAFFGDITVVGEGGKPQLVVSNFSTPKREFASQTAINPNLVEPVTGLSPKTDTHAARTVPEPNLSVKRFSPIFDAQRFTPLLIRKLKMMDRNRAWLQTRFPLPYDFQYQIDVRAKYRTHMNQIINAIQLKFWDYNIPVKIEWGEPFGIKPVYLEMENLTDNSVLETSDESGEALLRSTATILLKGWLIQKLTTTPTMLHFYRDIYIVPETYDFADGAPNREPDLSILLEAQ